MEREKENGTQTNRKIIFWVVTTIMSSLLVLVSVGITRELSKGDSFQALTAQTLNSHEVRITALEEQRKAIVDSLNRLEKGQEKVLEKLEQHMAGRP